MTAFGRVLVAVLVVVASLFLATGTSQAGVDNELTLVDGQVPGAIQ